MRLHCTECGKYVSTEVPEETVVRAILVCPKCIARVWPDDERVEAAEFAIGGGEEG
jgi:hypothetical protein